MCFPPPPHSAYNYHDVQGVQAVLCLERVGTGAWTRRLSLDGGLPLSSGNQGPISEWIRNTNWVLCHLFLGHRPRGRHTLKQLHSEKDALNQLQKKIFSCFFWEFGGSSICQMDSLLPPNSLLPALLFMDGPCSSTHTGHLFCFLYSFYRNYKVINFHCKNN